MSKTESKREKLIQETAELLLPPSNKINELTDKDRENQLGEERKRRYAELIKSGMSLDDYKKSLLIDFLIPVMMEKEKMHKFISGVYEILGYVPKHLTETSAYFKEFAKTVTPKTPEKITYPTNMFQSGFRSYNGTLPIISYLTPLKIKGNSATVRMYHGHLASLAYILWMDRFVMYFESKAAFGYHKYYANEVHGMMEMLSEEGNDARFAKYNERFKRTLTKSGNPRKHPPNRVYKRQPYLCGSGERPGWQGSVIYKPNLSDPAEIECTLKRLFKASPSGRGLTSDILKYLNPNFEELTDILKNAGQFMFRFEAFDGGHYASLDAPEKFKKMSECFHQMGDLALKLSEDFNSYKNRKMIGRRTADVSLGAKLLTEEIISNPMRFINECFSPGNWYKQDSIIYWFCKELIQGE